MKNLIITLTIVALAIANMSCKEGKDWRIPAESVTLDKTSVTLIGGDTLTLTATVLPKEAFTANVTWESSDPIVATVVDGKITALTLGSTNIFVFADAATAVCAVTVNLGTVSFATDNIWPISGHGISQIWSDAVQATGCGNKTTFFGTRADCRSNPDFKGDLFSWHAVSRYKNELCPPPWRVPTRQDFINLDIALGGSGGRTNDNPTHLEKYLNIWGGEFGGVASPFNGQLGIQHYQGYYWSQTQLAGTEVFNLRIHHHGFVDSQNRSLKDPGYSLRCVRDY